MKTATKAPKRYPQTFYFYLVQLRFRDGTKIKAFKSTSAGSCRNRANQMSNALEVMDIKEVSEAVYLKYKAAA